MRIVFFFLLIVHGVVHLLGFIKAFKFAPVSELNLPISEAKGILWLLSAILFVVAALLFFLKSGAWWIPSIVAVLLSQYLIFTSWQDAKFGTIVNIIILTVTILALGNWRFSNKYENEVKTALKETSSSVEELLTEADIRHLPEAVQNYLHYTGSVGKPKVKNFRVEFTGQIRKDEGSEWMPFTSEQYNFIAAPTRLFFMRASMKHLPVSGFHYYKNGEAFMDIRLLSLFRVQYQSGKEMNVAETVTFFNDMCLMAPATLIDKRIQWLEVEGKKVKAAFSNQDITISACLYFNEKGELINFISEDRYAQQDDGSMKKLPWSTPIKDYREINGYTLAGYGDAVYSYPDRDLIYGNLRLSQVAYNLK